MDFSGASGWSCSEGLRDYIFCFVVESIFHVFIRKLPLQLLPGNHGEDKEMNNSSAKVTLPKLFQRHCGFSSAGWDIIGKKSMEERPTEQLGA